MSVAMYYSHEVLSDGVLPDLESDRDIVAPEIVQATITQEPTSEPRWGFVARGRRFPASLSDDNLKWAIRVYASRFHIGPQRAEAMTRFLDQCRAHLGPDASPDELYVVMRDLLALRDGEGPSETPVSDAYRDLWQYEADGGFVFDNA